MIKPANRFPKPTKDVELHIVEAFNEIIHLSLDGHPNAVHACQELEDPAYGWRRGGVVDGVRHGCLVSGPMAGAIGAVPPHRPVRRASSPSRAPGYGRAF